MSLTTIQPLPENRGLAFVGDEKRGAFELTAACARRFLAAANSHGKPNGEVVRPWIRTADILRTPRNLWIVDFPPGMDEREAALFQRPFARIRRRVKPTWGRRRQAWWVHGNPQPEMRIALAKRDRFIAATRLGQSPVFVWLPPEVLPEHQLIVFARDDDWFFGVLHSRFHQIWARRMNQQSGEKVSRFRYSPARCFETFPFPWPPATPLGKLTRSQDDHRTAVAQTARLLDAQRSEWLGDRTDPRRTLTALYHSGPAWLQATHAALDEAVAAAYGWPIDLPEEGIISRLLALNQERSSRP